MFSGMEEYGGPLHDALNRIHIYDRFEHRAVNVQNLTQQR